MTDILTLIETLAPLILLVVVPIMAVWALDAPGVHVPESGAARAPAIAEPEAPRWRFDRLTPPSGQVSGAESRDGGVRRPHPGRCVPA